MPYGVSRNSKKLEAQLLYIELLSQPNVGIAASIKVYYTSSSQHLVSEVPKGANWQLMQLHYHRWYKRS